MITGVKPRRKEKSGAPTKVSNRIVRDKMIWYPYEQMKTMQHPYKIIDADGVYLYTEEKKLIDSISSWWSVIHGYKNPEITAAIKEQADIFSHIMLGSLTHESVEKLAKKLNPVFPAANKPEPIWFFSHRKVAAP